MQLLRRILLITIIGMLAFSLPPVLLTSGSYLYYQTADTILPNVRVGSVDVGGFSLTEAAMEIDTAYNQNNQLLLIEVPSAERSWSIPPAELGLRVDGQASAMEAYMLSRQGGLLEQIRVMLEVLKDGSELTPTVVIDAALARSGLERWAEALHAAPLDASLKLSGSTIQTVEARSGLDVDVEQSLALLEAEYDEFLLHEGWVPIVTRPIDPARSDITPALTKLEDILSIPPVIRLYDPVTDEHLELSPGRETISKWITLRDDGQAIHIEFNAEEVADFVEQVDHTLGDERSVDQDEITDWLIQGGLDVPADEFVIEYRPTEYVTQPGDTLVSIGFIFQMPYWKLEEANPEVRTQGFSSGQILVIPPRDDLLLLPVIPTKRIVISIQEQRMWVFEDGELKWEFIVSTGIPNSPTLPGVFQINSHYENAYASNWDLYMPHFMGIYDAVPGLTNGIHGLPVLSSGRRLWANVLGSPASYGCIILDLEAAEQLYNWAEEGVVVEIQG